MPPITMHMIVARNIADDLENEDLDAARGAYLLGATTPDIRVITKQDRASTHYFDLNVLEPQDSVAAFLKANAKLLDSSWMNADTRAFVAGYISHLVLDEQYITTMYRKYFLTHDALGGQMRANVMDRLLQFDMDRRYGNAPDVKLHLCSSLDCRVAPIAADFVTDEETLERWRVVTADVASHIMDWDRIRGMITNHLRFGGLEEGETLSTYLDSLPQLLDETLEHITLAEVEGFLERATDTARAAVERYLA
jgi:hypothetical protein